MRDLERTLVLAALVWALGPADPALGLESPAVVVMRSAPWTVLTVAPPPQAPVVLAIPASVGDDDIRLAPAESLERALFCSAPRTKEYWELDPCEPDTPRRGHAYGGRVERDERYGAPPDVGTQARARLRAAEAGVELVRAGDAIAIEDWLEERMPGLEPRLRRSLVRAYGRGRSLLLVDGSAIGADRALRVHWQEPELRVPLPVGPSDEDGIGLLLGVVAEQRFEAPGRTIGVPTPLVVPPSASERFPALYGSVLRRLFEASPNAVVMEYAGPNGCDDEGLTPSGVDFAALGADLTMPEAEVTHRVAVQEQAVIDAGGIGSERLESTLLSSGYRRCYRELARERPAAAGEVEVTLSVRDGEVTDVAIESGDLHHGEYRACLDSAFRSATFRGAPAGRTAVRLRLTASTELGAPGNARDVIPTALLERVLTRLRVRPVPTTGRPELLLALEPAEPVVSAREPPGESRADPRTLEDLAGGAEWIRPPDGYAPPEPSDFNAYASELVVRHRWEGPLECEDPIRGRWLGVRFAGRRTHRPRVTLRPAEPAGDGPPLESFLGDLPAKGLLKEPVERRATAGEGLCHAARGGTRAAPGAWALSLLLLAIRRARDRRRR